MMKRFAILLLVCFQTLSAQKNIDPTPEDIATAKKLREKYSKDDIAILSATETVTFAMVKTGGVAVNRNVQENLMNIGHRADIQKYEVYDSGSEIQDFNMKYRNNKDAGFLVKDEFYKSDDLFYVDYRVKYMNLDFPVQGYTYNYELNKKYGDIKYFTSMYFHDDYPTVKKEIVVTVPKWLDVELREFNFDGYSITKSKRTGADGDVYTYSIENIDGYPKEESTPGPSYIYPHLLVIAKSYTNDGKTHTLFSTTADLYKWYKSLVDTMDEKPDALAEKVKELTANAKSDDEKIRNIYYWVQDNIRYIAFEDGLAGFRPDASQNVFQKRYGDCKGMANLTRQMLKLAGFDARLTWIGTKRIAYDYNVPSLGVDNHMICTLFKDGKTIFLDGTEKYNSLGEYADRIQGKEVMIENGDKYIIGKVPLSPASANKEIYNSTFSIDNEILTGTTRGSMKGESRASFIYGYNGIKNDKKENALQSYLSKGDKNFAISNVKTSDLTNRDQMLTFEYNALLKNRISTFDNDMYIDLDYLEEFASLDFKERKTDFEFSYKKDYESNITLEIPAGYAVTRMPEPLSVSNDAYTFNISCEQQGNNIIYKKHFLIKTGTIKKSDFSHWNTTVAALKNRYNDTITLTKQ